MISLFWTTFPVKLDCLKNGRQCCHQKGISIGKSWEALLDCSRCLRFSCPTLHHLCVLVRKSKWLEPFMVFIGMCMSQSIEVFIFIFLSVYRSFYFYFFINSNCWEQQHQSCHMYTVFSLLKCRKVIQLF